MNRLYAKARTVMVTPRAPRSSPLSRLCDGGRCRAPQSPVPAADNARRTIDQPPQWHDFAAVRVYPDAMSAGSQAVQVNGRPAFRSLEALDDVWVSGGDDAPHPAPAPRVPIPNPPPPPTPAPPKAPKTTCPSDIKAGAVGTLKMDASFAKAGWLTGWGGFAQMQVSDAKGKNWNGTAIHENLKGVKDTCKTGKACSNQHGEGGSAGSTFTVGEEGDFLGLFKLPASKNAFYDFHIIGMKGVSHLHKIKKPSCEIQCEQQYDCGGKRFGPDFLITYKMKQETIKSGKDSFDVTSIELEKGVKK